MGTVPTGTGELRRIHSRVSWMSAPVDRSMIVSAPQRVAHTIFSTSSAIDEVTTELPMFALTFTANFLPMIIGSSSGWFLFAQITARPAATSVRTSSASTPSRAAMNAISGVVMPARAQASCVDAASSGLSDEAGAGAGVGHDSRIFGRPPCRSGSASVSVYGPDVS